jgi:hypothetical protein
LSKLAVLSPVAYQYRRPDKSSQHNHTPFFYSTVYFPTCVWCIYCKCCFSFGYFLPKSEYLPLPYVSDVSSQLRTFYSIILTLFVDLLSKKLLIILLHQFYLCYLKRLVTPLFLQYTQSLLVSQCEVKNSTHTKSRYVLLLNTYFSCTVSLVKEWMLVSLDKVLFGWEVHVAGVRSSTYLRQTNSILFYTELLLFTLSVAIYQLPLQCHLDPERKETHSMMAWSLKICRFSQRCIWDCLPFALWRHVTRYFVHNVLRQFNGLQSSGDYHRVMQCHIAE